MSDQQPNATVAAVPRNPAIGLAVGVGWALAAASGFVVFADLFSEATGGEIAGRAGPAVLVTPFIWTACSLFALIRGVLAIGPRVAYRNRTSLDQHRAVMATRVNTSSRLRGLVIPGVLVAILALALYGAAIVSALTDPTRFSGAFLLLQWAILATIVAAFALGLAAHIAHYRRFAVPVLVSPPTV